MPVHIQEPDRLGAGGGVVAGQPGLQLRTAAVGGEFGELAPDGFDLRGPVSSPSTRPRSAGRIRVAPSARGSRSNARNTSISSVARSP